MEDYGDLLAVGRAEAKRLLRTHENVSVKDILYSAKCGVHVIVFEVQNLPKGKFLMHHGTSTNIEDVPYFKSPIKPQQYV